MDIRVATALAGLEERSRRPLSCPGRTSVDLEELVLATRVALIGDSHDHGPQSIVWELQRRGVAGVPARSTVWRILTRRAVITPQPQKRAAEISHQAVLLRPTQ